MNNIATSVESAAASVQSSIIKPRFREEDILFSTLSMYEDDDIMKNITSTVKYAVPGTNSRLLSQSDYFTGLGYTLLRQILAACFIIYTYYLRLSSSMFEFYSLLSANFWYLLSLLSLPEDLSTVGPASIYSSSTIHLVKHTGGSERTMPRGSRIYHFYQRLLLLPTRLGNIILENSLSMSTPRTRMQIRKAIGRFYIPNHIAFIFEMSPLVVPQPPEIPTPFLDYEKRIVIPDKKEVATVLAKRAEWASMHHTHKAAETFRVIYEAAKCITWAACSEVCTVTVFESNGYSWRDMGKMASVIREEMQNLTKNSYRVSDSITLINLSTLEIVSVFDKQHVNANLTNGDLDLQYGEDMRDNYKSFESNIHNIIELDPAPESIVSSKVEDSPSDEDTGVVPTFRTNLTVFLMSNKETDANTFRQLRIKQQLYDHFEQSTLLESSVETQIKAMHYPTFQEYVDCYTDPELLIKFCTQTQALESLAGYPLVASGPQGVTFIPQSKPANFQHYCRCLREHNNALKRKYI